MAGHYLKQLFEPSSVAVFGASEQPGAVGTVVTENLLSAGFSGQIFLLNPKYQKIRDLRCYKGLEEVKSPVDLAVICTPAATVPNIMESCGIHGVKTAIIMSSGFRESGPKGQKLEEQVIEVARNHGIRFVGPNCLGAMRPSAGLNVTFNKGFTDVGNLALISQSGALCTAILDWADNQDIGFSAVISIGASADVGFGEVLDYLVTDPHTHSILLYVEGVNDARSFMSGLRAAARVKPVIVVKVGRHKAGGEAAMSHTGAMVGADDVFEAALRRAGAVRGMHIGDLFSAATVLSSGRRLHGERLAIITNAGGPGAMACDRASDLDIPLAKLSDATVEKLNQVLPAIWSHANPVDIIGDAGADRYGAAMEACLTDKNVDGVLVMLTPQAMSEPTAVAERVVKQVKNAKKPVLACWMGDGQVAMGRDVLTQANIPNFRLPETAVQGVAYLTNFYRNQQLLLQTPGPLADEDHPDVGGARLIIENALAAKRNVLTELESKAVLAAFGIPSTQCILVRSADEALVNGQALGFPLAMKIYSKEITHKSDIGGVRLGLSNAAAVQSAFKEMMDSARAQCPDAEIDGVVLQRMHSPPHGRELLVGITTDPVFGPVITFGLGGTAVEIMRDQAMALPPLNSPLIKDLIGRTKAAKLLAHFRNMPAADMNAIERILLRVSSMACELPWIQELDINPLVVDEHGAMALDARIIVKHRPTDQRPYSHMAIHPYPSHLVGNIQLPGGIDVCIRPIRPEDAEIEQAFVRGLSDRAKFFRFFQPLDELTPTMLARFTQIDYDREMAFIAVVEVNGKEKEIGVARYITNADNQGCEFAVVVADEWQHRSIAQRLMERLIECAREDGLKYIEGKVIAENKEMLALAASLRFTAKHMKDDDVSIVYVKKLLH
ncbi:MAG: bifunctional acetate--CoA ligase family protein/GNAT family N-acetyltransferase [Gammaproteobacteria bacterium]|nr:bifunctional acetate--CoA ligase family protein/GNAT family N-acetyltransferase [Gammaproteobacteria bacterium]